MPLYLSMIHWTNEIGSNQIVGLFDDVDLATTKSREFFESVHGEARTQIIADLTTEPESLLHRVISWNGELNAEMQMPEPGSSADIYEMPVNAIYPGSVIAEVETAVLVAADGSVPDLTE